MVVYLRLTGHGTFPAQSNLRNFLDLSVWGMTLLLGLSRVLQLKILRDGTLAR